METLDGKLGLSQTGEPHETPVFLYVITYKHVALRSLNKLKKKGKL